jgi:hypothetical protein
VTGPLIAPVIPSPAAAAGRPGRAPAAARTLPLAVPPAPSRPPALGRDVVYGLARVDRSGRVADRTVTGALGWRGGDRLTLTAEAVLILSDRVQSTTACPGAAVRASGPVIVIGLLLHVPGTG